MRANPSQIKEAQHEHLSSFRFLRIFFSCAILGCLPINGFLMGLPHRHTSYHSSFSYRQSPLLASSGPENKGKFGLSRSERKARERARKMSSLQNGKPKSQPKQTLTVDSTMQDLLRTVKLAETKTGVPELKSIRRFLSNNTEWHSNFTQSELASLYTRTAVASLGLSNQPIVRWSLEKRHALVSPQEQFPKDSYDLVRALAKAGNITEAWVVLDEELPAPSQNVSVKELDVKTRLKYRVKSLVSIISEYFARDAHTLAVESCQKLAVLGTLVRQTGESPSYWGVPWLRLVKAAAKGETLRRTGVKEGEETEEEVKSSTEMPCNMVYTVLNAMCTFPPDNDDLVYEAVSTALVRRVEFVKGAVNLEGCPKADRGEAAFIGRSNVGKSSLVNMITNRKSLAFTSQTPGKTQQFNFFAVNDKPGLEKEIRFGDEVEGKPDLDCFYMVDLPGFGFAVAPEQERTKWADFMKSYLGNRERLRVVFHLIDGRHGPIAEDATIMRFVKENLQKGVAYVIVLTKADKNVNRISKVEHSGAIKQGVMTKLQDQMKENGVAKAPILITSARTRLGRLDLWRYLRLAAQV